MTHCNKNLVQHTTLIRYIDSQEVIREVCNIHKKSGLVVLSLSTVYFYFYNYAPCK